jgi:hypothetical protein
MNNVLSNKIIKYILEFLDKDLKLLVCKVGSTNEERNKILSIELIMRSGLEEYFRDILLSNRFKEILCTEACNRGFLSTLEWAVNNGCELNPNTCAIAAYSGHLNILQWAKANGCNWNYKTCSFAAYRGHLNILKWARANGCDWNYKTCTGAVYGGHLNILKWAIKNGCKWNSDVCYAAAEEGHLNILQWAVKNGCPWNKDECRILATCRQDTQMTIWIDSTLLWILFNN